MSWSLGPAHHACTTALGLFLLWRLAKSSALISNEDFFGKLTFYQFKLGLTKSASKY